MNLEAIIIFYELTESQLSSMTKKYAKVTIDQRLRLIQYIYDDGLSIRQAALRANIIYPTAKAIHKIYITEKRIDKKDHRFRTVARASCKVKKIVGHASAAITAAYSPMAMHTMHSPIDGGKMGCKGEY